MNQHEIEYRETPRGAWQLYALKPGTKTDARRCADGLLISLLGDGHKNPAVRIERGGAITKHRLAAEQICAMRENWEPHQAMRDFYESDAQFVLAPPGGLKGMNKGMTKAEPIPRVGDFVEIRKGAPLGGSAFVIDQVVEVKGEIVVADDSMIMTALVGDVKVLVRGGA